MIRTSLLLPLLLAAAGTVMAETRVIGDWPDDLDDAWKQRDFEGRTRYRAGDGDPPHIVAVAEAGASALFREVEVDLTETPWLQWLWRVEQLPDIDAAETEKPGDDYGARVYVVRQGPFGKLSANALNYVWSQQQPVGDTWPNAYTGRSVMWSVEQGSEHVGEWMSYTRDVRADWQAAFGDDIERIRGIAIMTDADDSASRAEARYGRIRFCATPECGRE